MSNPHLKPKRSIASYGNPVPVAYLNATASEHNGITGDMFAEYTRIGLSNPKIARLMANTVTASTVKSWKRLYKAGKTQPIANE